MGVPSTEGDEKEGLQRDRRKHFKIMNIALAKWLIWLEHRSVHQKFADWIPGGDGYRRKLINVSLSLRTPLSLKSITRF